MTDKKTIQNQNLADLVRVVIVLSQILETKELTRQDEQRLEYTTKVIKNVKEKCHA